VGRTLRGPVNRPVLIRNFAEFQRVFGALAAEPAFVRGRAFFRQRRGEALIVRVVNGARAPTSRCRRRTARSPFGRRVPGRGSSCAPASTTTTYRPGRCALQSHRTTRALQGGNHVEDQEIFPQVSMSRITRGISPMLSRNPSSCSFAAACRRGARTAPWAARAQPHGLCELQFGR